MIREDQNIDHKKTPETLFHPNTTVHRPMESPCRFDKKYIVVKITSSDFGHIKSLKYVFLG